MDLRRLLQINMATLAALGAVMLGMGQRSVGAPLLVILAAVVSVWLTDITGRFRLGRRAANILMIAAAAVSLRQLWPLWSELQALTFSWLLIYLQIILFFQAKDQSRYWLLVVLSLLQVVVATLFSQGIWFGMLLAAYMVLGFSALTLLLLGGHSEGASGAIAGQGGSAARGRWPLAARRSELTWTPAVGDATVGRELFRRLGRMSVSTMSVVFVLFFAVPRYQGLSWRGPIANPSPSVGYSDTVELGELGAISENRDAVMRVRLVDNATETPLPEAPVLYLQGAVLSTYQDRHWRTGHPSFDYGTQWLASWSRRKLAIPGLTREEIRLEGLDHRELFFIAPYIPLPAATTGQIDLNCETLRLRRSADVRHRVFEYVLGTTAIVAGAQSPFVPAEVSDDVSGNGALQFPMRDGKPGLPNLTRLAGKWIAESGLPESDRLGRARWLEGQFARSGRFTYSLKPPLRDSDIDPIEDFVTKHPQGHCEYFATALTLMLRSQGIPARLIVGYKCDEWSKLGGFYQVRELHAHTWVEAYLRPRQIAPESRHGAALWVDPPGGPLDNGNFRSWGQGGWVRLDPTPGSAENRAGGWLMPVQSAKDWLDYLWAKYVVDLNHDRQRDAIYGPIKEAVKEAFAAATDPARWRALFRAPMVLLYLDSLGGTLAALAAAAIWAVAAALLAGGVWLLWHVARRLAGYSKKNHRPRRGRRIEIEFYCRLEALLARHGLVRDPGQTQREFADAAGLQLAMATGRTDLERLPTLVADAFYRVRFGHQPLDSLQSETVEQAMREISEIDAKGRRP